MNEVHQKLTFLNIIKRYNIDEETFTNIVNNYPQGTLTSGRKWYPEEGEEQECCHHIRRPSANWPWSLYRHCLSTKHIALKYNVPTKCIMEITRFITQK